MTCTPPCYAQTPAEAAVPAPLGPVVPADLSYPPGNVKRYGAVGDGTTADDNAIKQAIAQAIQNSTGTTKFTGSAVYFPKSEGDYVITTTIDLTSTALAGPVRFHGECDRLETAGPRIRQTTSGLHHFSFTANPSTSVTFENISFSYSGSTHPSGIAFVYINPSPSGLPNSFYFKNCWFQETSYYALNISNCDDIQILGCTFDSTSEKWLGFGLHGPVTHVSVVACTFKNVTNAGQIDLGAVDGFVFEANRVYWDGTHLTPYVINALSGASTIRSLVVQGNVFEGCQSIVALGLTVANAIIANNTATSVNGTPAITFGGGSAVSAISITGNIFSGYAGTSKGMIDATGTPVSNSIICNNTIIANVGGSSDYAINLPYAPVSNNSIASNNLSGATIRNINTSSYANNGITESGAFQITLTGVSGTVTASAKYSVEGNAVTLTLPNINGTSNSTAATITATGPGTPLSTYLCPASVQSFLITVTNAGANVLGAISIGTSGVLSLYVGAAYGAFTASGNKGIQFCAITYQLG